MLFKLFPQSKKKKNWKRERESEKSFISIFSVAFVIVEHTIGAHIKFEVPMNFSLIYITIMLL